MDIRFLGHACFELIEGDTRVLVDPFLSGNPKAAADPGELEPTHIFLTHGHPDHYGDIVDIAKRTGAQCVAIAEVANELGEQGVENVADPNIGGNGMGARVVIPSHYDPFPPIETDAQAFKSDVEQRTGGKTTVEVLEPGGSLSL